MERSPRDVDADLTDVETESEDAEGLDESLTLDELFLRVNSVIPEAQQVATVKPGSPSGEALDLMASRGFSQVPIVRGKHVIGLFSYRSFAAAAIDAKSNPKELAVEDAMEQPVWVRATDALEPVIEILEVRESVLVGDEDDLQAVVTTMDILRRLDYLAQPFIHLRGIELALRQLVDAAMTPEQFAGFSAAALEAMYAERDNDPPAKLEETSLGELIAIVLHGRSWELVKRTLGANRANAVTHLDGLSGLRNDVLHFRRSLSEEELSGIKTTSDWLRMRMRASGLSEGTDE